MGEIKSEKLTSFREKVEVFMRAINNDNLRNQALDVNPNVCGTGLPGNKLNLNCPFWEEMEEGVEKARSGSAPGPSGIPHKVYKKCPQLLWRL